MQSEETILNHIKLIDIDINNTTWMVDHPCDWELRYCDVIEYEHHIHTLNETRLTLEYVLEKKVDRCEDLSEDIMEEIADIQEGN